MTSELMSLLVVRFRTMLHGHQLQNANKCIMLVLKGGKETLCPWDDEVLTGRDRLLNERRNQGDLLGWK